MGIEILGIQILGCFFGLFMIYYTFLHYKRKELLGKEYTFWIIMWAIFITVTLIPEILDPIVSALQLTRTMDLLIIIGFMFFAGMMIYIYILVKKNQKKTEEIVRKIAIKDK